MEMNEILNKIAELKEMAKKAEALAGEIEAAVALKATETREAMYDCLDKGKEMDKAEYFTLSQQTLRFEDIKGRIETAAYKLSTEVVGNLEKIA